MGLPFLRRNQTKRPPVLVLDASGLVAASLPQWLDTSGAGNHTGFQGTGTAQPTVTAAQQNGKPTVKFDGGDSLAMNPNLYSVFAGPYTLLVIAERDTDAGTNMGVVGFQTGTGNRMLVNMSSTAGRTTFKNDAGAGSSVTTGVFTNTNYQLFTCTFDGVSGLFIRVNGGATGSGTGAGGAPITDINSGTLGGNFLGGITNSLVGGIAELRLYPYLMDANGLRAEEAELSGKWDITLS